MDNKASGAGRLSFRHGPLFTVWCSFALVAGSIVVNELRYAAGRERKDVVQ